jgi:hypothetical protein
MSLTNPSRRRNPEGSNLENEGAMEWVPLFLSSDQETSCPERHRHDWQSEVVHYLTGKLSHIVLRHNVWLGGPYFETLPISFRCISQHISVM